MRIKELNEARKNPEINKKENIIDSLLEYSDDETMFLHTTSVEKVGINPTKSKGHQDTPAGIYCYQLKNIKHILETSKEQGVAFSKLLQYFGGNHMYVLKSKVPVVDTLETYSENDLEQDIKKLKNIYGEEKIEHFKSISSTNENFVDSPIGTIWAITKAIAIGDPSDLSHSQYPDEILWNSILTKLGFVLINDVGYGFIHNYEKSQAVFLNVKGFDIIDHFNNDRKQKTVTIAGKEYKGGRIPKNIEASDTEIFDIDNLESNQYTDKVESINIRQARNLNDLRKIASVFSNASIIVNDFISDDAKIKDIPLRTTIRNLIFVKNFPTIPSEISTVENQIEKIQNIFYNSTSLSSTSLLRPDRYTKKFFNKIKSLNEK